ncbi:hypothetical protein BASA60_001603 [Batrachochytrium salamandrivorans]|nr:hypothetical protein BASA60_001603 [Batrachochytrium salamandrivorans]
MQLAAASACPVMQEAGTFQALFTVEYHMQDRADSWNRLVGSLWRDRASSQLVSFCEHHICFLQAVNTPSGPARMDVCLLLSCMLKVALRPFRQKLPTFRGLSKSKKCYIPAGEFDLLLILDSSKAQCIYTGVAHLLPAEPPKNLVRRSPYPSRCSLLYQSGLCALTSGNDTLQLLYGKSIQEQFRVASQSPISPQSTTWTVEAISPIAGQEHMLYA